jgi:protocatechuate 3,4-dioxygenase beta subunit
MGSVADRENGTPVTGGLVWLGTDPACYTQIRPDGSFEIALPAVPPAPLIAEAPGFAQEKLDPVSTQDSLIVRLARAPGEVRGRVVDRKGAPIPFAVVKVASAGRRVATGADGNFSLDGLPVSAEIQVEISAPGFAPSASRLRIPKTKPVVDAGSIVLNHLRLVRGLVKDRPGRPLNAFIMVDAPSGDHLERPLGPEGAFELGPLAPGTWSMSVQQEGRAVKSLELEVPPGEAPLVVPPIDLAGNFRLEGMVVDAQHKAVEGACVFLHRQQDTVRRQGTGAPKDPPDAVSGVDGRFEIRGLSPGEKAEIEVWKDGFSPARVTLADPMLESGVEVSLRPAATVEGTVVSESGAPIDGASVQVNLANLQRREGGTTSSFLITDEEGHFRISSIAPGRHTITVIAEGFATAMQDLSIAESDTRREVRFTLQEEAVLAGKVVDEWGEPVAHAQVSLELQFPFSAMDGTSADGSFLLERLPPGKALLLSVLQPDFKPLKTSVTLLPGRQEMQFVMERAR